MYESSSNFKDRNPHKSEAKLSWKATDVLWSSKLKTFYISKWIFSHKFNENKIQKAKQSLRALMVDRF